MIQGSSLGFGFYGANLNFDNQSLPIGEHRVTTQLYAQVPSGAVIQFGVQNLTILPPQFLLQIIGYVVALIVVGVVFYNASFRKAKPPTRRRAVQRRETRGRRLTWKAPQRRGVRVEQLGWRTPRRRTRARILRRKR